MMYVEREKEKKTFKTICKEVCREELSRKQLYLQFHRVDVFYTAQWRCCSPCVFLIYRVVMTLYAIYALIHLIAATKPTVKFLAYLTHWTYLAEILFFLSGAVLSVHHYCCPPAGDTRGLYGQEHLAFASDGRPRYMTLSRSVSDEVELGGDRACERVEGRESRRGRGEDVQLQVSSTQTSDSLPWYVKIHWALGNVVQVFAPIVTVIYYLTLYPSRRGGFQWYDFNVHGLNTVMIVIDAVLISARPVRVLHAIYPAVYGLVYVIGNTVYWAVTKHVLYPKVLDWNYPGSTIGVIVLLALVIVPALQLIYFGLYKLKLKVCGWYYGE